MNKRSLRWIALALIAAAALSLLAACDISTPVQTTKGDSAALLTTDPSAATAPPSTAEQTPDPNVASLDSAQIALDSFISNFGRSTSSQLEWNKSPYNRSQFFWTNAEIFEVLVDYAGVLDDEKYDKYVKNAFNSFQSTHGDYNTWTYNEYNDDLMWITIGAAKAYLYTGDEVYRDCATTVFNYTVARAWTGTYGGGMVWKEGNTSKNSCVNYPAAIAACLLYKIHGSGERIRFVDYPAGAKSARKMTYLDVAKSIYAWSRTVFRVNDPENRDYGRIYDNIDADSNGNIKTSTWDGTYNQGTFIGSAALLYELTGDKSYLEDAKATFHYAALVKYGTRTVASDECNGNDLPGFKGIMMRWICYFIKNHYDEIATDMEKELAWVTRNLTTAWKNRNSKNIIWTAWATKTNDKMSGITVQGDDAVDCYSCWGCSAALSLLINYPYELMPVK